MSRELQVLWAGRRRRDSWEGLCSRYRKRIGRFVRLREVAVRGRGSGPRERRLRAEGQALLAAVAPEAWTVALDRGGTMHSSRELATWLQQRMSDWPRPIAFLLGSDLGLDGAVLEAARERLSLGALTLPHELARLVLYEQLYRCFCITSGIKYHREPL